MGFIFSDLKLDGEAPVRARPDVGEWGPVQAVSTASKKRGRWLPVLAFVGALVVLLFFGYIWYIEIHG